MFDLNVLLTFLNTFCFLVKVYYKIYRFFRSYVFLILQFSIKILKKYYITIFYINILFKFFVFYINFYL